MPDNNTYLQFVQEVKQRILENRYQASKLVNKELLLLYYNIGKILREKVKQAKLTSEQVLEIRRRGALGESRINLGQEFGVHPEHIRLILRRGTWKHI